MGWERANVFACARAEERPRPPLAVLRGGKEGKGKKEVPRLPFSCKGGRECVRLEKEGRKKEWSSVMKTCGKGGREGNKTSLLLAPRFL